MSDHLYDIFLLALRIIFLLALPVAGILAVSGLLAGFLQSATGVKEQALNYAVKLVVFIFLAYLFFPVAGEYLQELFILAYK